MTNDNSDLKNSNGIKRMVFLAILFVGAAGFYQWQNSSSGEAMRQVASEMGFEVFNQGQSWRLQGNVDNISVSAKTTTDNVAGDTRWFTEFRIDAPGQPSGKIMGASLRQKVIDGLGGSDWLSTGDAKFDKAVLVAGDQAEMLAHFTPEARKVVIDATASGWALENKTWTARESGRINNAQTIRSMIETGLAAARALALGGGESAATFDKHEQVNEENAVEIVMAEVDSPRSLSAAILLANKGDQREEVLIRLGSALYEKDREKEVIIALGKVGGLIEVAGLSSVKGEYEELAKETIAKIKSRLESEKNEE